MRRIALYIILVISLVSCEREIDLGYRSLKPLYVVNSSTDESRTRVEITRTVDMYLPVDKRLCAADKVLLTCSDGRSELLQQNEDGAYESNTIKTTAVGEQFTLGITIDNQYFESSSSVVAPAEVTSTSFVVDVVMGLRGVSYRIEAKRGEAVDRYFRYLLRHEGEILASGVIIKYAADPSPISCPIFFAMDDEDKNIVALVDEERKIKEGDKITCEFFAIDPTAYDYFYTLSLASQSSNNPSDNFSGGCLGYFLSCFKGDTLCDPFKI